MRKMAACAGDIVEDELDRDEINIALSLSEALQAEEVEKFLFLYDSIPSNIGTEHVNTIKEMARQLAALPKKQFELYRSKKVLLSADHSLLCYGGSCSFKGKLSTDFISDSACLEMSCGPAKKGVSVRPAVTPTKETPKQDVQETSTKKKKTRKSKKNKLQLSSDLGLAMSSSDKTVDLTVPKIEEKCVDTVSGKQFSVQTNNAVVVDNSTNCEAITVTAARQNEQMYAPLQHEETEENEKVLAEPCNGGGIRYYKDPPFGFPPSTEKIFMSALGLLPTSLNYAHVSLTENNPVKKTCKYLKTTDQKAPLGAHPKGGSPSDLAVKECANECGKPILEDDIQKPEVETLNLCLETEPRPELRDSLTSPSGNFMVEAESIDGDVSSSSAKEDEQWQSQTKRPYRKKKRELAARAGREKSQMDRNQKKWEHKQHLENVKKNNNYYHKKTEDKKHYVHKEVEKNQEQCSDNTSNPGKVHKGQATVSECLHPTSGYKQNVTSQTMKSESSSSNNAAAEANSTSKKTFSYRDALLRNRNPKEENHYSSDSGVDANSVSSCESVLQPEAPKQVQFNHEDVRNYLMTGWQGVLDGAKKGLVSIYGEGAYPGSHKWQRTKNQPKHTESQSRPPLMR